MKRNFAGIRKLGKGKTPLEIIEVIMKDCRYSLVK